MRLIIFIFELLRGDRNAAKMPPFPPLFAIFSLRSWAMRLKNDFDWRKISLFFPLFRPLATTLFLCGLLGLGTSLSGQDTRPKISKQPISAQQLLEQARAMQERDPQGAIRLLEQAIARNKSLRASSLEVEAYVLLGDIFADIKQDTLALARYRQASQKIRPKQDAELAALIYYRGGQARLRLEQPALAISSFNACLTQTQDPALRRLCEEGLADAALQQNELNKGLEIYQNIQAQYPMDSLTQSRLEAKKSYAYTLQNDQSNANLYRNNSLNYLPDTQIQDKDVVQLNQANQAYIQQFREAPEEASVKNRSVPLPSTAIATEKMELADLAIEKKRNVEAGNLLVDAAKSLDEESPIALKAEVLKRTSDFYLSQGDYTTAVQYYQAYTAANEVVLQQKQEELDQQIAILQQQQQIDIQDKNYSLAEKDAALLESRVYTQWVIIAFLGLLLLGAIAAFFVIFKNVRKRQKANKMLLLRSLRTQMNPHFIFNALNSINHYIVQNDERAANKFLSDFSRLMRKVLEHSQEDLIPLEEETQLLTIYLKLEHQRFRDKFSYQLIIADDLPPQLEIPPMLIQPFVENAIWHGLRYKEQMGDLLVQIKKENDHLLVLVQDNGIGREKSIATKTENQQKYRSTGLKNTYKRIELINSVYQKQYDITIKDFDTDSSDVGTLVQIKIPLNL